MEIGTSLHMITFDASLNKNYTNLKALHDLMMYSIMIAI